MNSKGPALAEALPALAALERFFFAVNIPEILEKIKNINNVSYIVGIIFS